VALVAVTAFGLTACGSSSDGEGATTSSTEAPATGSTLEPEGVAEDGGNLVIGITAESQGWNPAINQWADAGNFVGSSFLEPLMTFKADGTTEPFLAESVTPEPGSEFTVWTIKLRPGITFHDGTPLDAEAAAKCLEFTYLDPSSLTRLANGDYISSVEVVDDLTVKVTTSIGWSGFPGSLAAPAGYMMAPAMLDSADKGAKEPIGTGPFRFESWSPDEKLQVVRYDDYWGEPAHLDGIEFQVVKAANARNSLLETGTLDAMTTFQADDIDRLSADYEVIRDFNSEKTYVMLNAGTPPFDNANARKALAHATNREALVERLGPDVVLSDSPTVGGTTWEVPDDEAGYVDFDTEAARADVAAYLAETGESTLEFSLAGVATLDEQELLTVLQSQWADVGIKANIESFDQTAYVAQMVTGGYQAAYWRSYSYLDPDINNTFWHSDNIAPMGQLSLNFSRWSTPLIDDALTAARLTDNVPARQKVYSEVVKLRNEAAIDIWLFNSPVALIANDDVKGLNRFRTQPFANYLPKPWWNEVWLQRA